MRINTWLKEKNTTVHQTCTHCRRSLDFAGTVYRGARTEGNSFILTNTVMCGICYVKLNKGHKSFSKKIEKAVADDLMNELIIKGAYGD